MLAAPTCRLRLTNVGVLLFCIVLTGCTHVEIWHSPTFYSHNPSLKKDRLEARLRTLYEITCHISNKEDNDLYIINGKHIALLVPSFGRDECRLAIPYAICESDAEQDPTKLCERVK